MHRHYRDMKHNKLNINIFCSEPMITPITKDLCDELEHIAMQEIGAMYRPEIQAQLADIESGQHFGLCVMENNKPAGYVIAKKTVNTYQLLTIAVDENHRNKGYGSQLVDGIFAAVQQLGGKILNVTTDADANDALRFYLKNGFVLTGIVQDEFIPGVAQAHLTRRAGFIPQSIA